MQGIADEEDDMNFLESMNESDTKKLTNEIK